MTKKPATSRPVRKTSTVARTSFASRNAGPAMVERTVRMGRMRRIVRLNVQRTSFSAQKGAWMGRRNAWKNPWFAMGRGTAPMAPMRRACAVSFY